MSRRRSSFLLRIIGIGALAHVYVGLRLIGDAGLSFAGSLLGALALVLSLVLIPASMLGRASLRQPWSDRLAWAGMLAMGLFSSLFVFTALRDVLLLVLLGLNAATPAGLGMGAIRTGSAHAVAGLALLTTLAGLFNARRRARVRHVDVPVAGLPAALHGFTIVQLSDIHVGPTIKRRYVQAIVDAANALSADLVAITGDVVDGSVEQLANHAAPLGRLAARHGVYLVTGNHEYYSGAAQWIAHFRQLGLHVLLNEHAVIRHGDEQLVVAGVTDYSAAAFDPQQRSDPARAIANAPAGAVRILLAHQPRSAMAAEGLGYALQLSGHTHGGQFWPWGHFVRLQQPYTAGLHRHGDTWVYISRGTGYWGPPKRLGAPSEITCLRLVSA